MTCRRSSSVKPRREGDARRIVGVGPSAREGSAEAAGKRLSELESRLQTLEASKADAVSHKRFSDAQDAATEIKTVLEQIDAARASTQTDVLVVPTTPSPSRLAVSTTPAPPPRNRVSPDSAPSPADTTDAIALVRLLHGDVLEDLDDDASQID